MKLRKAIEKSGGIKELVVAVLIGAWMLYQFIASFSLPQSNFDSLGSNGYARIVSGVGIFCIVLYMVQKAMEITKQYRSLTEEDLQGKPDDAGKENVKFWSHPIAWMRLHHRISMLVMCILYVFLIDKIGFILIDLLIRHIHIGGYIAIRYRLNDCLEILLRIIQHPHFLIITKTIEYGVTKSLIYDSRIRYIVSVIIRFQA